MSLRRGIVAAAVVVAGLLPAAASSADAGSAGRAAQTACVSVSEMSIGARNAEVKVVQTWLRDHRFRPGPVDGWFGKVTRGAVRRAEAANGWTADGRLDVAELGAMGVRCGATPTTPAPTGADPVYTVDPAKVYIPKLGISRTVLLAGDNNVQTLIDSCRGAVRAPGFVTPVYLAAHRTSCGSAGFGGVETLKVGDIVRITYADGTVKDYRIRYVLDDYAGHAILDPAQGAPVALQTSLSGGRVRIVAAWPA